LLILVISYPFLAFDIFQRITPVGSIIFSIHIYMNTIIQEIHNYNNERFTGTEFSAAIVNKTNLNVIVSISE